MIARTTAVPSAPSQFKSISRMNDRSIFSVSIGSHCKYASDEYPVPKSSSAMLTPVARIFSSFAAASSVFFISSVSVISNSSQRGSNLYFLSTRSIVAGKSDCENCSADTFTATRTGGNPLACHAAHCPQASSSTHSPNSTINPDSSAIGTNFDGGTGPNL